jgi:zinc and cadmium transporter
MLQIFLATFFGGLAFMYLPQFKPAIFKIALSFIGSYLFSLIVLHLLPGLFTRSSNTHLIGLFIIIGFFLQIVLGSFSEGIEHGHIHDNDNTSNSNKLLVSPSRIFIALYIHSFLDGVILNSATLVPTCSHTHHHHHTHSSIFSMLMLGMMLHKFCDAFSLVSVLKQVFNSKKVTFMYLLGFAMATPLGYWISNAGHGKFFSQQVYVILSALAVGNLLQISTTIFFEACPHHKIDFKRFIAMVLGVLAVVLMESFV